MKALTFLARRFVAGETAESAVAAGERLRRRGIRATFDLLGEDVRDRKAARRAAKANEQLLRLIPPGIERNVSIKLTTMGLDISEDFCLELSAGILDVAREVDGFVRIDMEGSKHTQRTLDAFRKLRARYDNLGIVLQACLQRTQEDVREAVSRKDRVRLCKGAYKEPPQLAWTNMQDIRNSYRRCAEVLLDKGGHPAIATHDESLIRHAIAFTSEAKIGPERFEFQLLYGLRPRRWDELVRAGYDVRIYVPYGTHWLPYFSRRLRERKENIFFVVRSLFGG